MIRWSELRHALVRHGEAAIFWTAALLYVVPIWAFPYIPTQDGPSHLYNAQILKDYDDPAAGYAPFFELRGDPLPNLTSHVLLAALLYVFPPLIAEKVLVSLYVLGFAGGLRYFLGAFGPSCRPLSWAGLLLVYNRCFWMGFYNYCLSLVLFWLILGYVLRRRGTLQLPQAAVLLLLFTLAYFTHLVGFLLALAGALLAVVLVPPRQAIAPILVVVAALPALCLAMDYFEQTGFFQAGSAMRVIHQPLNVLRGGPLPTRLDQELASLDDELVGHHAGPTFPLSLALVAYWGLLLSFTLAGYLVGQEKSGPGPLFPALFGLLLFAGFVLIPNHLSFEHGGFLKARLAPLPPLLWLACMREPPPRETRLLLRTVTALLLGVNLLLVTNTIKIGNQYVAEYTAGIEAVGHGHRLFLRQVDQSPFPLVNPLLHAGHYYCLGTGNVNLDNYEASTPHFPVKYRAGVRRGKGFLVGYPQQDAVDTVLCWTPSGAADGGPASWVEIFNEGPLRIYRRPPR
jgi:hypothetical protein